jgi:hypothetical protein
MQNITIGRYSKESAESHGWAGFIEPSDRRWILFLNVDGTVELYDKRDPVTGAVL